MKDGYHFCDIIFCVILMPGMMFLFPLGEWMQWHSAYVALYVIWVYGVWLLCRKVLGPMLRQGGWRSALTVGLVLFLIATATFLMTLTPVDFPQGESELGKTELHIRAMWVLLIAAVANGLPVGMLRAQLKDLSAAKEVDEAKDLALAALESRRADADTGETVMVKSGYKTVHIPLKDIRYIQGRNNYACFYLDHQDDVVTRMSLKEVMEKLPEGAFVRIHNSYIVPLWRIETRNHAQVKLLGVEEPFPVGRAYKDKLKDV